MSVPSSFTGWGAFSKDSVAGNFKEFSYEPKKWDDDDVDIKIQYCGVCASDLHVASSGWMETQYPVVVGHEIVGVAVRVGSKVTHIKEGDIVGVGAQSDSCGACENCAHSQEQYCGEMTQTYGDAYKRGAGKGDKSYGGYADYHRAPGHFVFKIPDGLDPAFAAPMMCGGTTVYAPLKQYGAGTTAKNVGIIGIGGLGHFGLLFAKALGAEQVVAISHSESKKADALKMGATKFIATHGKEDAFAAHAGTLDLIVCTSNDTELPLDKYLSLLRAGGKFVFVGAPESASQSFALFPLLFKGLSIHGSLVGSPATIKEMLELAASASDVKPWIVKRDLSEVNSVIPEMDKSGAKYRFVLVNTANGGQL